MAARPKNPSDTQPALPVVPAQRAASVPLVGPERQRDAGGTLPLPATVDYQMGGEAWRVLKFPDLAAEFDGLTAEKLADFHTLLAPHVGAWQLVRRLFGVRPVLPGMGLDPDDARVWPREEILSARAITKGQLQEELNAARGLVTHLLREEAPRVEDLPTKQQLVDVEHPGELNLKPSRLLAEHHLEIGECTAVERAWFEGRVAVYLPVLKVPMADALARNCLMAEWNIHTVEHVIRDRTQCVPGEEKWTRLSKLKTELTKNFNDQFTALMKICPWAGKLAGQYDFQGVVSDLTKGIMEYEARGTTQLVDGMFTGLEIQVELRRSQQAPTVRYRAGLVTYVNAARANLWNPDWNPLDHGLTPHALKALDVAWSVAAGEVLDTANAPVPDLQADGAAGEYESLVVKSGSGGVVE